MLCYKYPFSTEHRQTFGQLEQPLAESKVGATAGWHHLLFITFPSFENFQEYN